MVDSVPAPRASAWEAASTPDRFVQERLLGQGGMGAVYLVRDPQTGEQLALKKLFRMDGRSVLRLKREFRSVADMSHPNLVKVYELGHTPDGLFLTMEYVPGQDLKTYLDRGDDDRLNDALLPVFRQLASGVHALHQSGVLHRDLKPSNVLVADRRVVVLDFGLVRELDPNTPALTEDGAISGTPAYMAPEQALGKPLSEASDWYAFGVMLYEALTGVLPFEGAVYEILRGKLERDLEPPERWDPRIPQPLSALCMKLLARDPALRPRGDEVLARLTLISGAEVSHTTQLTGETSLQPELARNALPFFGRGAELDALEEAALAAEAGQGTVVHVRGVSGTGKSALVERFLARLERRRSPLGEADVLVLRSRCYEREALPFKALDGVIDALTRHLSHQPDYEVGHLLPSDVAALTQLFPVLERLRPVQQLLTARVRFADARHSRQRGEMALTGLLSRLAEHRPLVIWIDDLQWGDVDSAAILKRFLQQAARLPLLLLLSYRSDEVDTSECLRLLLSAVDSETGAASRTLQVSALGGAEVAELCREQLGEYADQHRPLIEHIVRESEGSPFLAAQLTAVALTKLVRGTGELRNISLADLVAETAALLPDDARQFLRVLSIAARPIPFKLALRAAGLRRGGREIVHTLRRQLLVRTRDVAGDRWLEVYHDRVRESVQRAMPPEDVVAIHGSLLAALEFSGQADPAWLYTHAVGAQQRPAALRHGLAAAERAMSTLAFGQAAELYGHCVQLSDATGQERATLIRRWGDALANAGRGSRAADAYFEAAELCAEGDALELRRIATTHLLRSGRFVEGEAWMRRVLSALGLRMPESAFSLMAAILWERMLLLLRGDRVRLRKESEITPSLLLKIDACNTFRTELASIDPIRMAWFMLRALRWSLAAGEPKRLLSAFVGLYYVISHSRARRAVQRSERVMQQIQRLYASLDLSSANAVMTTIEAVSLWMRGQPEAVLAPSREAERLCRENLTDQAGGYHFRFGAVSTRIGALWQLGDYRDFAAELSSALDEARATENLGAELSLALNETLMQDLQDRPERAIERLTRQRGQLPVSGFGVYHAIHMLAIGCAANATARYDWGRALFEADLRRFERSPVRQSEVLRSATFSYGSSLLLGHYVAGDRRDSAVLERVQRWTRRAEKAYRDAPYLHAITRMVQARLHWLAGEDPRAIEILRALLAAPRFSGTEFARMALGRLLGGSEGAQLCSEAESKLREQGVANPADWFSRQYPELSERS